MNNQNAKKSGYLYKLAAAGLILGGWKLLTLFFPPMVFPTIGSVAAKLIRIGSAPVLYRTVLLTAGRLAAGLGIGIGAGCVLGGLMGISAGFRKICSPVISLFQTVPPVSWVVMALIWFGFNGRPAVFIIVTATFPVMAISIAEGFAQMDRKYLELAKVYQFTRRKTIRHVILPSLPPFFHSAFRISLGGGWKIAVMGEVLTTSDGIGGMIKTARLNVEPESVVAWTVVIVILYYLSDWALALCFRRKKEQEYASGKRSQ